MSIIAKREALTLFNKDSGHDETHTYISIYNKNGELLSRSGRNHPEGYISHVYDELEYVSCNREGQVLITLDSINNKFSKPVTS